MFLLYCAKSPKMSKSEILLFRKLWGHLRNFSLFENSFWILAPVVLKIQNCPKGLQKSPSKFQKQKSGFSSISSCSDELLAYKFVNLFL